jgi:hypothetical protein
MAKCPKLTTTSTPPTPPLSSLKRLPSHRIFYGTAGEWGWLRAGLAERPVHVSLLAAGYVALFSRMSEPSLPLTARGRFGDTRSRLAAGSGWRKPQAPHSLLAAGLGKGSITARGRFEPKPCGTPGHTAGRRAHRADDSTSDMNPKPLPITDPIGGPPVHLRREVLYPPVGD